MGGAVEPDLVDRLLDLLQREIPHLGSGERQRLAWALRAEFGGERTYIRRQSAEDRAQQRRELATLSAQRGVAEAARRVGVSRTHAYRLLKRTGPY